MIVMTHRLHNKEITSWGALIEYVVGCLSAIFWIYFYLINALLFLRGESEHARIGWLPFMSLIWIISETIEAYRRIRPNVIFLAINKALAAAFAVGAITCASTGSGFMGTAILVYFVNGHEAGVVMGFALYFALQIISLGLLLATHSSARICDCARARLVS